MTSLFDNLDNSSDSEEDSDYVPPVDEVSSDEEEPLPSSDDEVVVKKKGKNLGKGAESALNSEQIQVKESESGTNVVDVKKKADDIYKSFLDEVAAEMGDSKNESGSSVISCSESATSSPVTLNNEKHSQSATTSTPNELFEFAGETISVQDGTLKSDSSDILHSPIEKQTPAAVAVAQPLVKRKGLESVLGTIQNKKQKLTVLQKSMLDWKSFKKEECLEEDLEKFNRGKGGFIERQRFLQRSDLRSYEIERDLRLTKRPTITKRDT